MRLPLNLAILVCFAVSIAAAPVLAVVTLDGSIAGDDYSLESVQTVESGFNNTTDNELNAAWAKIEGNVLYLTLTGNLASNFNKLNIFIDSVAGGENTLTNSTDFGGNNPSTDGWAGKHAGFTFDRGFEADYLLSLRNGFIAGPQFDVTFNSVGNATVIETSSDIFGGSLAGANPNVGASGLGIAFDNSNVAGVAAGDGPANQAAAIAVQTGLELAIPLAAIGSPGIGDCIKISAMINGTNHDYLSNQFLGSIDGEFPYGQINLGGDGEGTFTGTVGQINLNDNDYASGLQYFQVCIVPEPSSLALVGLAAAAFACIGLRRRK